MAWQKFRRVDSYVSKDDPLISIAGGKFTFNALFARTARLSVKHKVIIHVDAPSFRLGFEFAETEDPDALGLRAMSKGRTDSTLSCAAAGISSQLPWVAKAATLRNKRDRQFKPKQEGNLWVIQLRPAFELTSDRFGKQIPPEVEGIYRCLNDKKEVVYIGRGRIRERLASPERKDWDFASVEFSIVESQDERERWEAYWITRFKEDHGGKLPYYNMVSGTSRASDAQRDAVGSEP